MEENSSKSGIKLIAELAGVSIGTVDRVLHNRPGVNKETKEKVLKIIQELNYQPNILARRLVSKKKFRFAVIIPAADQFNSYWVDHMKGVERAQAEISQFGISIDKLIYDQHDVKSYAEKTQLIEKENYDGILLVPFYYKETYKLMNYCSGKDIPCVFIDTNLYSKDFAPLTFIGQNSFKSGYFAGRFFSYLVQTQEEVLVISINAAKSADNHVNYLQREEGFRKFINENKGYGARFLNFNSSENNYLEFLEKELKEALTKTASIKGIFVTNSRASIVAGVLDKLKLNGYRLLGYDLTEPNVRLLKEGKIDFLISQDPANQGYLGVQSLYRKLILNEEFEPEHYMPLDLITRENIEFYGRE
jgi:LacI family transcriptional regulator